MKTLGTCKYIALVAASALLGSALTARAGSSATAAIGQATIFWHDNEWQVYQDGRWIPYAATRPPPAPEPQMVPEPNFIPPPEVTDTNGVYSDWGGWGYGFPLSPAFHRHHFERERRFGHSETGDRSGAPVRGLGQTTIGIGRQSRGLGQTTIGIGQPTIGIGQPTIGIGKPAGALGQQMSFSHSHSGSHSDHSGSGRH